jgi:hypothetical protein
MASPYVPLDSWIYLAFERLPASRYVNRSFLGMKPWRRIELANQLMEAREKVDLEEVGGDAAKLVLELEQEFAYELGLLDGNQNRTTKLESVYSHVVSISGPALNDSYHFGQTIINNFGRPYQEHHWSRILR